jgi:hypothetical protein
VCSGCRPVYLGSKRLWVLEVGFRFRMCFGLRVFGVLGFFLNFLFSHSFMDSFISCLLYGSFHDASRAWHSFVVPIKPKYCSNSM